MHVIHRSLSPLCLLFQSLSVDSSQADCWCMGGVHLASLVSLGCADLIRNICEGICSRRSGEFIKRASILPTRFNQSANLTHLCSALLSFCPSPSQGRTVPNVASIIGCQAEILQLDVIGVSDSNNTQRHNRVQRHNSRSPNAHSPLLLAFSATLCSRIVRRLKRNTATVWTAIADASLRHQSHFIV